MFPNKTNPFIITSPMILFGKRVRLISSGELYSYYIDLDDSRIVYKRDRRDGSFAGKIVLRSKQYGEERKKSNIT